MTGQFTWHCVAYWLGVGCLILDPCLVQQTINTGSRPSVVDSLYRFLSYNKLNRECFAKTFEDLRCNSGMFPLCFSVTVVHRRFATKFIKWKKTKKIMQNPYLLRGGDKIFGQGNVDQFNNFFYLPLGKFLISHVVKQAFSYQSVKKMAISCFDQLQSQW